MKFTSALLLVLLGAAAVQSSFLPAKDVKVAAKPVVAVAVAKADDTDDTDDAEVAEVADDDSKRVLTKEEQKADAEEDSDVESAEEKKADAAEEAADAKEEVAEVKAEEAKDAEDAKAEASFSQVAPTPVVAVAKVAPKQSPHVVPVPSKPTVKLPIPHGHPEAKGVKNPKPVTAAKVAAVAAKLGFAAPKPATKVETKPVVVYIAKQSQHAVPVPSKPTVKLPIPHGHPEARGVKNPKPVAVAAKVAEVAAKIAAVAAPKPAVKVEAKPVVAITAKVSPHIVPVPAKPTVKLPTPAGHPEGPQSKKVADAAKPVAVSPKPVAKVVTKPVVPKAAVAVAVTHTQAKVEAKPAHDLTMHEHAVSAQKSAGEALHHLEKAKKAFEMTKSNVKETLKVGKKIEGTADKIETLYTPPKAKTPPAAPKESAARSLAVPAFVAMLIAALASC